MLDAFLQIASVSGQSGLMWHWIKLSFIVLLENGSSVSQKQAAILATPHLPWWMFMNDKLLVQLWAAAASGMPYTDEVGQSVVNTLLQIPSTGSLRPYIPVGMWLSRTLVSPNNITHLCQGICNIKRGSPNSNNIGQGDQINNLKELSKSLNSTPDLDPGKHDKDGLGYAKIEYNKLLVSPPTDNLNTPGHYVPPRIPSRPSSTGTPSEPPQSLAPSGPSARTSSLASSNTVEDSEELPLLVRLLVLPILPTR